MGLGTNHSTVTTSDKFIPEQWSDEVLATYKSKLVLGNLVKKIPFSKKQKGDTLHIPVPARGSATAKVANTAVSFIADTANEKTLTIDKQYYYAKMYEDIAELLAKESMRRFYTDDAGYALAKQVDQDLHKLGATLQGGSIAGATNLYETAVIGGDGSTAFSGASSGNGTALTDAGLRKMIQTLEDQDVDMSGVNLIIPPVEANVLRGISRFTEQAFIGDGSAIRTGGLGNLYGINIYVSTNCPWIHCNSVTNTQSVTFSSAAPTGASYSDAFGLTVDWNTSSPTDTKYRVGLLMSNEAIAHAEAMAIRTQDQYDVEYLGTMVVSDTIYGVGELRDYAGLAFVVPA